MIDGLDISKHSTECIGKHTTCMNCDKWKICISIWGAVEHCSACIKLIQESVETV